MKIAILGPVTTKAYFGGVAIFDEGLAAAFQALGHEARIFSWQRGGADGGANVCFLRRSQTRRALLAYAADLVIASLDYGMAFFPKIPGKKILFLHGFFSFEAYGAPRALAAVLLTKLMAKRADAVAVNSSFSAAVNRKIWKISADEVVPLGASAAYLEQAVKNNEIRNADNGQILFAGRLVPGKHTDTLIRALRGGLAADGKTCALVIAGDGPERQRLERIAKETGCPATFLGRIRHEELYELYRSSEIFVSLNDMEPYGIVFVEALLAGCKIICPASGGQVSILNDYRDRSYLLPVLSEQCLRSAVSALLKKKVNPLPAKETAEQFSFQTTAKLLMSIK